MSIPTPQLPVITRDSIVDLATAIPQLIANLQAIVWSAQPAFQRVELFTTADPLEAFESLLIAQGRACIVVWGGDDFTDAVSGAELRGACRTEITVMFVSTVIGDLRAALLGNDTAPGLFALRQLVLPAVTGVLIPSVAFLRKIDGTPVIIRQRSKGNQLSRSRVAYALTLEMSGGEIYAPLGYKPII